VVLIHGYLGGHWGIEERAWPLEWMRRIGLDVALALLPFHALRSGGNPPRVPGADARYNNEGFRQAMWDLRSLIGYLKARGAPAVGVMGMSLGGYATSLLATVEEGLSFAVPIIPLASIADFARDHGRLGGRHESPAQHQALEEASWLVSPFARRSKVASDRMLIVGAEADRITPIAQAERLARHFSAPLHRLYGGHLLQLGRGEAFREIRRLLHRLQLI
jgi:pimeloyl-ACP methyl ester carboxylesterase